MAVQKFAARVLAGVIICAATACAGESDALAISANIQARHFPFGTVVDPIFSSSTSDEITGYTRCGDSAIWTGHYLAAEAFRYKVTGDSGALTNIRKAITGLESLVNVTGTGLLARCLVPINSPFAAGINSEESSNGIHISGQNYWIGNTSRDQYSGVMFGLAAAYDFANDRKVRGSCAALISRMLSFLLRNGWNVVMPDLSVSTTFLIRPDEQLALLAIGTHVEPRLFENAYDLLAASDDSFASLPIAIDSSDVTDSYFKFNLDYINLYHLIAYEKDASRLQNYQSAYKILRNATATHANAHFNMIDRALNGANATRDADTASYLAAWLLRPKRDFYVDLEGQYATCGDSDTACDPLPVQQRVPTDFLWQRSPFQLSGGGQGLVESAGIDYILPYWMARYYDLSGI